MLIVKIVPEAEHAYSGNTGRRWHSVDRGHAVKRFEGRDCMVRNGCSGDI